MFSSYATANADIPLYRFVSFFDLYDLLTSRRLRFSKLATMQDRNEGIGFVLRGQEDSIFRQAFIDRDRIPKFHEYALENHYVSCWTMEPESMAMWSLYSPDSAAIRISTSVSKLHIALQSLLEEMHWRHCAEEPGTRKPVAWDSELAPVKYVNFVRVRDEIRESYRASREFTAKTARLEANYFENPGGFFKDRADFHQRKSPPPAGLALLLKDEAYLHEKEVRACLSCGVRNEMTLEEFRTTDDMMRGLIGDARTGELSDFVYAKVDSTFLGNYSARF